MSLRNRSYFNEATERKRLPKYGEVYKKTVSNGDATIVVRGIFQSRIGDSYHVRVLRGSGDHSDELNSPRKAILYKDDHYLERNISGDLSPKQLLKKAVDSAMEWIKSSEGRRKIAKAKTN